MVSSVGVPMAMPVVAMAIGVVTMAVDGDTGGAGDGPPAAPPGLPPPDVRSFPSAIFQRGSDDDVTQGQWSQAGRSRALKRESFARH